MLLQRWMMVVMMAEERNLLVIMCSLVHISLVLGDIYSTYTHHQIWDLAMLWLHTK